MLMIRIRRRVLCHQEEEEAEEVRILVGADAVAEAVISVEAVAETIQADLDAVHTTPCLWADEFTFQADARMFKVCFLF